MDGNQTSCPNNMGHLFSSTHGTNMKAGHIVRYGENFSKVLKVEIIQLEVLILLNYS